MFLNTAGVAMLHRQKFIICQQTGSNEFGDLLFESIQLEMVCLNFDAVEGVKR